MLLHVIIHAFPINGFSLSYIFVYIFFFFELFSIISLATWSENYYCPLNFSFLNAISRTEIYETVIIYQILHMNDTESSKEKT